MIKVHVKATKEYDIIIDRNLLKNAGGLIANTGNVSRAVIVSDENVFPLYGLTLKNSLSPCGINSIDFIIKNGEESKSMSVYEELLEFLCKNNITRSDVIVALGGGVVGDLSGFAAATYQRGIKYVQIPTTLLSAVDSSVGGKTAINLKSGKNQVGCFYQPSIVICDVDTLQTLPEKEFSNGMAEVIKYAMYGNKELFSMLAEKDAKENVEEIIKTCVSMKRDVVIKDEFDRGDRMILNFGHTIGHAIEACSNYSIPHGEAVAMGMVAISKSAALNGYCSEDLCTDLKKVLDKYNLKTKLPFSKHDILEKIYSDKKISGREISVVLPKEIGDCFIEKMPFQKFKEIFLKGESDE